MSKKSDDDLLSSWEDAKKDGIQRASFAQSLGISKKALDNRLYRAKKHRDAAEEKINYTVEDILDGNYRLLVSKTKRIKTLQDLIEACSVDLDEWMVDDKYEIGTWEMGRRAEQKDLSWEDGKMTGQSKDTGQLWIESMYRLRAVLVRKKPKPIYPMVQPIRFDISSITVTEPPKTTVGKVLIVPDSQMGYRRDFRTGELTPFHDRRAHDIVMQIAATENFDAVTYLGDGLDFSEWSDKFVVEQEFYYTTQPAIIEYAWFLSQMKSILPNAEHEMILGNHEDRVTSMMRKHLYAACQLKPATEIELDDPYSIQRLLGLKELGIKISDKYPNGEVWHGEYLRCVHTDGISSTPGGTVSKMIKDLTATTVAGHNHSIESAMKTVDDYHGRRYVTAATCGCLCHLDYRVPGHKKGQNWQQGFAIVNYDSQSPFVELIQIVDGEAIYHGDRYRGEDYKTDLSKDTGWKF